VEPSK